jgi:hypothetical protein
MVANMRYAPVFYVFDAKGDDHFASRSAAADTDMKAGCGGLVGSLQLKSICFQVMFSC